MRVVLLSAEYPPMEGGVGDYTQRLGWALAEAGAEVLVLTSTGAGGQPRDPLAVHPIVGGWGWRSLGRIRRFLRRQAPQIVHLQYQTGAYQMHPAIHFLPPLSRGLPNRPQCVVTMHDLRLPYLLPKAGRLRQSIVTQMLHRAGGVIVTNGADWRRLGAVENQDHLPSHPDLLDPLPPGTLPSQPWLIPLGSSLPTELPGYDRSTWRAALGVGPGELLLGYFGLLHPTKGADLLVEALARLRRAGHPVRLLVVGGGTGESDPGNVAFQRRLQAQIERRGVAGAIVWAGPSPARVAAGHLRACDLVVLPYRDGASFRRSSLIAALSVGCAVVTTAPRDPAELSLGPGQPTLVDGQHAVLVTRGEVEPLENTIAELSANPSRRRQLSKGAHRLGQLFQWEEIAIGHQAVYRTLSRGQPLDSTEKTTKDKVLKGL